MSFVLFVSFVFSLSSGHALADEPTTAPAGTIARQQYARQQFGELTARMLETAELLADSQPGQAEAIRQALRQGQGAFVAEDMEQVIELLGQGRLAAADQRQARLVGQLKAMLQTLRAEQAGEPADGPAGQEQQATETADGAARPAEEASGSAQPQAGQDQGESAGAAGPDASSTRESPDAAGPAGASALREGDAPGTTGLAAMRSAGDEAWAALPAGRREALVEMFRQKVPERYARMLEAYYLRMSEQRP